MTRRAPRYGCGTQLAALLLLVAVGYAAHLAGVELLP